MKNKFIIILSVLSILLLLYGVYLTFIISNTIIQLLAVLLMLYLSKMLFEFCLFFYKFIKIKKRGEKCNSFSDFPFCSLDLEIKRDAWY